MLSLARQQLQDLIASFHDKRTKHDKIGVFMAMFSLIVDARKEFLEDEVFCEALRGRVEHVIHCPASLDYPRRMALVSCLARVIFYFGLKDLSLARLLESGRE
jgi:hypothetical protein